MEEKQLNFYQPLLSVRRFPSTVTSKKDEKRKTDKSLPSIPPLPSYRSELKSGPVRNPGTVPFLWEQAPGRPKDESTSQTRSPIIPKLPPGRVLKVKPQVPENVPEDSSVTEPEAGKVLSSSQIVTSVVETVTKFESCKDAMEEKESSDSEDSDEAYQDALDTLSRTESSFVNCSLSGLSGIDGPKVKHWGTSPTDPQNRDFMINRFLPAAKAMAAETPQHSSWKQPVAREKPKQLKMLKSGDKKPPLYPSRPNIVPNYPEDKREEESGGDEDDGGDESGNLSTKVCGLIPRFCLLNPVPGMSVRTRVPKSPVSRTQARSSSAGPCQETQNELTRFATHQKKSTLGPQKNELAEYKHMVRNKSNQFPYQRNCRKLEGSSLYSRLQGSGISRQQNELSQSSFYEEKGFLDIPAEIAEINGCTSPKCPISFGELLADETSKTEIGSASPVVEKTLYVDFVRKAVSPKLNSFSSDRKGLPNSDVEIIGKDRGLEETPSLDSLLKDIEDKNTMDEKVMLQKKSLNPADPRSISFSSRSDQEVGKEILKGFGRDQDLCRESIISANSKLSDDECVDFKDNQQLAIVETVQNPRGIESQCPLPPPLPKSPSESWLWRTLPSMSARISSSRSHLGARVISRHQYSKSPLDPKWETIVETTETEV